MRFQTTSASSGSLPARPSLTRSTFRNTGPSGVAIPRGNRSSIRGNCKCRRKTRSGWESRGTGGKLGELNKHTEGPKIDYHLGSSRVKYVNQTATVYINNRGCPTLPAQYYIALDHTKPRVKDGESTTFGFKVDATLTRRGRVFRNAVSETVTNGP